MPRPSVEAERRAQILDSACRVIARTGVAALRVADVAKGAGMSPGIIHYYFDNKRDLTRAAFEQNFRRSLERRAVVFEADREPGQKLRDLVEVYLPHGEETTDAWHVWTQLWATALHDTELRDLSDRAYGEWRRSIASIIRDGQAAGQVAEGDPVDLANLLIGVLDGLAVQVLVGSHVMSPSRVRGMCGTFLDRLLLGPAA
ncbi:TetR/AcrR family transcriptional regulator [Streptomyces sp. HNM0574]|uniref:TetR/AcrR family transcriptional regulator n=1 Tax=Streptomyces sp. HNM0574 TaxID=2714954 RepID=UPI00146D0724|nr:TetR/AcrR family transcriptional regulator [Streptomyces sp. HNM0574]NLU65806.1 TetR family transcriptional regulator [Streptomyces sp. HNM0574]